MAPPPAVRSGRQLARPRPIMRAMTCRAPACPVTP